MVPIERTTHGQCANPIIDTILSLLASYPISSGKNMEKQFSNFYKKNKDKIIKSLKD